MIVPVYQTLGSSTHLLAQKIGQQVFRETKNSEDLKATHTGTLDPMAEGVIIVLTGADRFLKGKLSNWKKTYQFQVLWGMATDSQDLLGLITLTLQNKKNAQDLEKKIHAVLPHFLGKKFQIVPDFSAKRIRGESYFDMAKRGEMPPKNTEQIEVFELKMTSNESVSSQKIFENIEKRINKISGDFRQIEILKGWKNLQNNLRTKKITHLYLTTFTAVTSKKTYIRALVRDLSLKVGIPATTFSIIRTMNGGYGIEDCKDDFSTKV